MHGRSVVDLNDRRTWPQQFGTIVEEALPGYAEDQWFDREQEEAALRALEDHLVRAYHCTRLTDREVRNVRRDGLRLLTPELVQRRLQDAVTDELLTPDEADFYGQTRLPQDTHRGEMLWFFTDRASLSDAHQIGYLLEVWGGEGINMALHSHSPEMKRLERVGTPSVVIANLDLSIHHEHGHPGILEAAVQYQVTGKGGTTIQSTRKLDPENIESIEQPGSAFWRRYVWTPRNGFQFD